MPLGFLIMLSWLVDHTLTVYILLLGVAIGLLVAWWRLRKRKLVIALAVTAGLAGIVFLLSLLVDSDRKRIWRTLQEMAEGIEKRDLDMTFRHIADDCTTHLIGPPLSREEMLGHARLAIRNGGLTRIHFFAFEVVSLNPPDAEVFFKAKPFGNWATGAEYCGCRATFRQDADGRWLMHKLELFKPESTEPLDRLY